MTMEQREQILEQLPDGTEWRRWYHAAENGEIRAIVKEPGDEFEKRYVVRYDENDYPIIKHKP